jgi:hypothetical protein
MEDDRFSGFLNVRPVQAPVIEGPRRPHSVTSGFLCVQSQDKNKLANIPTMQKAMATVDAHPSA